MDDIEFFFDACYDGRVDDVCLALQINPELVCFRHIGGRTPLHQAAFGGSLRVVEVLIQHGADPNATTEYGWVPLHYAAAPPNADVAECLIQNGADVNVANDTGSTPLHHAVDFGKLSMVELLLSRGAKVNAQNSDGLNPLDFASPDSTMTQLLLQAGARAGRAQDVGRASIELPDWLKGHEQDIAELLKTVDEQWHVLNDSKILNPDPDADGKDGAR